MAAAMICLTLLPTALAQHADPVSNVAQAKAQPATERPVLDKDQLLSEHQRLLDEENKLASEEKYAEAIDISQERESILFELAKLPDLKTAVSQARSDALQTRGNWQWLSGQIADAVQTAEQRLQLIEAEFGTEHWQSASARFALDYYRKLATTDAPTRQRMLELEQQVNAASGKGDYLEAIAKANALKEIEAKVLGVEHPFYASSLGNIAYFCTQARDYELANQEWQAAMVIRRKVYGDIHPDVLACYDGLAAVARQQRRWDAAHTNYDRAAPVRRQLFGTISPNDAAVWLDDFAVDSRQQYSISDNVQWEAGRLTLGPKATIVRTFEVGSSWEVQLELTFPAATETQTAICRFEFTLDGHSSPYALMWHTESKNGKPHTRLQLVEITPKPEGLAGLFAGEKLKVLRESDWPHDPSGRWSLSWSSGLLQVHHNAQAAFEGYVASKANCSGWTLRSALSSLSVGELQLQGVPRRVFSAEVIAQLQQAMQDDQTVGRLYQAGQYAEAVKLAERVLETRRTLLGENYPPTGASLNNLALLNKSRGNYAAAEQYYQRALKICETALGTDHPDTATTLNNLALLYQSRGNYTAAEPFYQRALMICEKVLGTDHVDTATSLNNLAFLYREQANHAAAEPLFQRALKIREKALGPDHPDTAQSLGSLAGLYQLQANYSAAEPLYQRAVKICETALGPDHPDTATSLNNLASVYESQGNYAAAEPLFQRALTIREEVLGPEHPYTASSLRDLAGLYQLQGNYAAAEQYYQRALKICETALGPDHPQTAASLNNLALLHQSWENYAAAEPLFQRALTICETALGPDHPYTATCLNNLASVYDSQGNYAAAESLLQRALKIRENLLGPEHPDTATSLNNLAFLDTSLGNYAAAKPLLEQALKIHEKALGPDHPTTAECVQNLALLQWWGQDQFEAAAPLAERALGIQLRHLDITAAIQTEQQQFLMSSSVREDVSIWLTVSGGDTRGAPAVYRDVLVWKGMITARQQGLRRALKDDPLFAEFARVSQELSNVALRPPLPPSAPKLLADWNSRAPELRRNWESQKGMLEAKHEELEKELAGKSVAFRESLEQRRVLPEDLVATLKAQDRPTALVDLLEYRYYPREVKDEKTERRIVAFVVLGDQPVARVELGAVDAIAQQVTQWRESILRKGNDSQLGAELRKRVWLPLESHLQGIETVLISTDGVLGLLPFEALPGKAEGTLLIEDYRLAFVPVPQMVPGLLAKPRSSLAGERLLLVGDVDYGTNPTGKHIPWKPLPGTADELRALSALRGSKFPKAEGLLALRGAEATERQVAENLSRFPVVHFATHGLFEQTEHRVIPQSLVHVGMRGEMLASAFDERPQTVKVTRSGLVLTGANHRPEVRGDGAGPDAPEDGLLMDDEILAMPLENASLVVMSACDTAQGKQQSGEGLLGIQRAFQVAGARTTVASLWQVNDAATVLLMQRFYENLWSGKMSRVDSLREAQLWMLRSGKQALRDSASRAMARGDNTRGLKELVDDLDASQNDNLPPYYWAAFQLSGDWR